MDFGRLFFSFQEVPSAPWQTDGHSHFWQPQKVFDNENELHETMIMKLRKTCYPPAKVRITSSLDSKDFRDITEILVPYGTVVSGAESYVHLATSKEERRRLCSVSNLEFNPEYHLGIVPSIAQYV